MTEFDRRTNDSTFLKCQKVPQHADQDSLSMQDDNVPCQKFLKNYLKNILKRDTEEWKKILITVTINSN